MQYYKIKSVYVMSREWPVELKCKLNKINARISFVAGYVIQEKSITGGNK
jgi:hypothetical protein